MDDNPPVTPLVDRLDLPALRAELRRTIDTTPAPVLGTPTLTRHAIAASLEQIKRHIEVGKGAPELQRFPPAVRLLFRCVARTLLYFLRFLTNRLRRLHHAQLNALHHLQCGLLELEQRTRHDQQRQAAEFHALLERKTAELRDQHRLELHALRTQVEELRRSLTKPARRAA